MKISKTKDIEKQIQALQEKKKKLEEKERSKIGVVIRRCNADKIPFEVLAGAILDASRAYSANDDVVGRWKAQGKEILNPGRGKKKFA
jgi:hypothetical protein